MNYKVLAIAAFCLLFFLPSCKFQKLLKVGSVDEKYEMAIKLYDQKDYSRAIQLFDQLAGAMRATDKSQIIAYKYAYCYYNQKDFTMASYYFKRFSTSYPNTPEAEECMFMSAYCNYLSSPEYSLDQTITYEALKEMQLFTNTYPKSKRVSECNDLMDQLRFKLEMKDFKIAKLFYRMEDYSAAVQSFNNILKDYPDTPHREEIMFLVVKSYYRFARQSIEAKQKERHAKTLSSYAEFIAQYPESKFLAEAGDMKEKSRKELEALMLRDQNDLDKERVKFQIN
jgi:outer membrane protein assembly factor BamD